MLRGVSSFSTSGGGIGLKSAGVLAQSGAPSSVTGTLTPTTLATIVVPANALKTNGSLRIRIYASWANNANGKTLALSFGGQTVITTTQTTNQGMRMDIDINNQGVANAQVVFPSINSFSQTGTAPSVLSVDTTQSQNLLVVGTLANVADTITLQSYVVELINP